MIAMKNSTRRMMTLSFPRSYTNSDNDGVNLDWNGTWQAA